MEAALRSHVRVLAGEIGERNTVKPRAYAQAADYIRAQWEAQGYAVRASIHVVDDVPCRTLEVERAGSPEVVLVGAHYDSVIGCPGANDNATGVAAMLEISRGFPAGGRTVRFVAFPNEEPPYFETPDMGSRIYAAKAKERGEKIVAMLSLETIGCYSDAPGSQQYPPLVGWFRPDRGNFIGVVGNRDSKPLVDAVERHFKSAVDFPVQSAALFGWLPGVALSDHASFWDQGYPGVMITDTAMFRYPEYHTPQDTPDKVNYPAFAKVGSGLAAVVRGLAAG